MKAALLSALMVKAAKLLAFLCKRANNKAVKAVRNRSSNIVS